MREASLHPPVQRCSMCMQGEYWSTTCSRASQIREVEKFCKNSLQSEDSWPEKCYANFFFLQEIFVPIYFLAIVLLLKIFIPEPYFPEVTEPEVWLSSLQRLTSENMLCFLAKGIASVFSASPFDFTGRKTIHVIPDTEDVRDFLGLVEQNELFQVGTSFLPSLQWTF